MLRQEILYILLPDFFRDRKAFNAINILFIIRIFTCKWTKQLSNRTRGKQQNVIVAFFRYFFLNNAKTTIQLFLKVFNQLKYVNVLCYKKLLRKSIKIFEKQKWENLMRCNDRTLIATASSQRGTLLLTRGRRSASRIVSRLRNCASGEARFNINVLFFYTFPVGTKIGYEP